MTAFLSVVVISADVCSTFRKVPQVGQHGPMHDIEWKSESSIRELAFSEDLACVARFHEAFTSTDEVLSFIAWCYSGAARVSEVPEEVRRNWPFRKLTKMENGAQFPKRASSSCLSGESVARSSWRTGSF